MLHGQGMERGSRKVKLPNPSRLGRGIANVTFLRQSAPIDEYGRALYAISRSIVRAMLDQLTEDDLTDFNVSRNEVTLRQLAKVARLDRDKGLRGDGFEWAVHEAIVGGERRVIDSVSTALAAVSKNIRGGSPKSLLFGHERAQYLGFLDAVIDGAGNEAVILPDGRGHPYAFGPWVAEAARGKAAEANLSERIKQIWKTDLFLTDINAQKYVATTIKSNMELLEGGKGLRLAIVPEHRKSRKGNVYRDTDRGLWVVSLGDPNGFMGVFNDAYRAVAAAITTIGRHERSPYYQKPSAKGERLQEQLEKFEVVRVVEIENALDEAAQQDLVAVDEKLLSVEPPAWLHMQKRRAAPIIAPRPSFEKLD